MELNDLAIIASQLRKPDGELGKRIGEMMNKGNELMNMVSIEELDATAGDNILEIGMGNGHFVKNILDKNATSSYTGCDFSATMVKEAVLNNTDFVHHHRAVFTKADVNKLPYNDNRFNKVFTVNTIYFWDDPKVAINEIKRVLKKGGVLIITMRPGWVMNSLPITAHGFKAYSDQDCRTLLSQNGFHIISILERDDYDLILSGEKYKNAFTVVKAIKN